MADESNSSDEPFLTMRQMVVEIRSDQKEMQAQFSALLQAAEVVVDHEGRIRLLERWKYGIPPAAILAVIALLAPLLAPGS